MSDYRVAVAIVLNNGVSPILHTISNHLLDLQTKIGDIERGFRSWGGALTAVSAILGVGVVVGIESIGSAWN